MPTQIEDLVSFLHDPNPQVVEIALEHVVQFSTSSPSPEVLASLKSVGATGNELTNPQSIFAYENYRSIFDLKQIIRMYKKGKTVNEALTILVNICDDAKVRDLIVKDTLFIKYLIEELPSKVNINAELMCILLANLGKEEEIKKIFSLEVNYKAMNDSCAAKENEKPFASSNAMDCLMDMFVKGSNRSINSFAVFDYLSYLFSDVSRFTEGREYFVTERSYDGVIPLMKLLVFTEKYDAKVKREGVAGTIKNSLFDISKHSVFLSEDVNMLLYILAPLCYPNNAGLSDEEILELPDELQFLSEDKQFETNGNIVAIWVECLLLFCSTRKGRELLRDSSSYAVIREVHKVWGEKKDGIKEVNDKVEELCDRVVQMLMRDEGENMDDDAEIEEIKDILGKVEEIEEEGKVMHQPEDSPSNQAHSEEEEEEDDDDKMVVVC
ncbi:Hgh1 protein [Martiniozyma asiatica (nom. inval.)]|nr:Hgh1 protein [Martiniozyma asiatica]